jgi:hypothetical protein
MGEKKLWQMKSRECLLPFVHNHLLLVCCLKMRRLKYYTELSPNVVVLCGCEALSHTLRDKHRL